MPVPADSQISWSVPFDSLTYVSSGVNQTVAGLLASVDLYRTTLGPVLPRVADLDLSRLRHPASVSPGQPNLWKYYRQPGPFRHRMVASMQFNIPDNTSVQWYTIHDN